MSIEIQAVTSLQTPQVSSTQSQKTEGAAFSEVLQSKTTDLDAIFETAARTYNLPVNLIKSVAKAESNFRADATSGCGAMGIMQLMPGTAKSLGVTDAYDPEQNIMGGAKYLRQMLDKFGGDIEKALAAYNAGPGAVTKYDGIPPYKETQNYVKKVMGYMGSDITAGSISYSGTRSPGFYRAQATVTDETAGLRQSITEMLIMKALEMQMSSSDDDDK